MKVTLILGTLGGRRGELQRFLRSLAGSTHREIELVVIDQSGDERVAAQLANFETSIPVLHLRASQGLSRARNLGLGRATGAIVAFPDDDCWYPEELLARVVERFQADPTLGALVCHPVDTEGRSSFPRWDTRPGWVDRFNVWRRSNSNALFVKRDVATRIGGFDETLGVGSGTSWGSAEDVDYPLRILAAGFPIYSDPALRVYHPTTLPTYEPSSVSRAESYAGGMGRVLRKGQYPWWFVAYQLIRPAGGIVLSLATVRLSKARYHYAMLSGRFKGWVAP